MCTQLWRGVGSTRPWRCRTLLSEVNPAAAGYHSLLQLKPFYTINGESIILQKMYVHEHGSHLLGPPFFVFIGYLLVTELWHHKCEIETILGWRMIHIWMFYIFCWKWYKKCTCETESTEIKCLQNCLHSLQNWLGCMESKVAVLDIRCSLY